MYKKKRNGTLDLALLMQEVHVNRAETVNSDLRFELRKRVHPFLLCSPVEFCFPMFYKTLDVRSV
jgi:hypothetical protein